MARIFFKGSARRLQPPLGVRPAGAERQVDLQRHAEVHGAGHRVDDHLGGPVVLGRGHVEQHLVVDLEDELTVHLRVLQRRREPHERDLEDVRGQPWIPAFIACRSPAWRIR